MSAIPAKRDLSNNPLAWVCLLAGLLGGMMVHISCTPVPHRDAPPIEGPFRPRPNPPLPPEPTPVDAAERILLTKVKDLIDRRMTERRQEFVEEVGHVLQEELDAVESDGPARGGAFAIAFAAAVKRLIEWLLPRLLWGALVAALWLNWHYVVGFIGTQTALAWLAGWFGGKRKAS